MTGVQTCALPILFETTFCDPAPDAMMRYAVPESWAEAGVRRWGFHGASHRFTTDRARAITGARAIITCHLGGSSSIAASRDGVAIGSSMGMSPQSGLPQNNRVGDLDPGALPYIMRSRGLSLDEAERQLTKESGLQGLSGLSNDVRDIEAAAAQGDARAQLALDVFVASARHWIGAYFFELGGADAIVFSAGIGEKDATMRARILAGLDRLGIVIDDARNANTVGTEGLISAAASRVQVWVIPTNEELVVARATHRLLEANQQIGRAHV